MKKQLIKALCLTGLALCFNACFNIGGQEEPGFQQSDLYGLWLEDDPAMQHYVRFTTEQSDETGYLYGREWNEEEDRYEEDLVPHGNGWFKYRLVQKNLTEIHLMDNGGAEVPQVYVVTKLTDDRLEYYYKEDKNEKYAFNKVVEKNE